MSDNTSESPLYEQDTESNTISETTEESTLQDAKSNKVLKYVITGVCVILILYICYTGYCSFCENQGLELFKQKTIRDDLGKDITDGWDLKKAINRLKQRQNELLSKLKR